LPVFDEMVTVAEPFPESVAGETDKVRGLPPPAVAREMLCPPVVFARLRATVFER
jgi:hypothetical protein